MMTNRQMVTSAEQTLELAEKCGMHQMVYYDYESEVDESCQYLHLSEMVAKMRDGIETWDQAKMGRWLGWIQASVTAVCSPGRSYVKWLDSMKSINVGNSAA